jgi:hypothetical protein
LQVLCKQCLPGHRRSRHHRHASNSLVVPLRFGQSDHDGQAHDDRASESNSLGNELDRGQLHVGDTVADGTRESVKMNRATTQQTYPLDLLVIRSVTTLASRTDPRPSLSSKNMPTSLLVSLAASCDTKTDRASEAASSISAETSSLGGSGRRGGGTSYMGDRRRGGGERRMGLRARHQSVRPGSIEPSQNKD